MISNEYYFKTYGLKSLDLKEKIEKGIKDKFNQESDILKDFDWAENELNNPNDIEDVLYYNSKDDFAIIINTKSNDDVIFYKNPKGENFEEIYNSMNEKADKYKGDKEFKDIDKFKAPILDLKIKREYIELQGKPFETADSYYKTAEIKKAIQTIKFSLDEKGGKIKSEAAIDLEVGGLAIKPEKDKPRYFYVDDTFAIFLREKGKELPFFAGRIDDITKFQ